MGKEKLKKWVDGDRTTTWVDALEAEEVAKLLLEGNARVLSMVDFAKNAIGDKEEDDKVTFDHLPYMTLRLHGHIYQDLLENLKEDGKQIIAMSQTGGRCGEFCGLLIDVFEFDP